MTKKKKSLNPFEVDVKYKRLTHRSETIENSEGAQNKMIAENKLLVNCH